MLDSSDNLLGELSSPVNCSHKLTATRDMAPNSSARQVKKSTLTRKGAPNTQLGMQVRCVTSQYTDVGDRFVCELIVSPTVPFRADLTSLVGGVCSTTRFPLCGGVWAKL